MLTGVAAVLCRRHGRMLLLFVGLAFGLHLASVVITIAVHEPLNVVIRGVGDPGTVDPAAVRAAFDEARWVAWHLVRTVATTVAFGCLAWALVLAGRGQGATNSPAR